MLGRHILALCLAACLCPGAGLRSKALGAEEVSPTALDSGAQGEQLVASLNKFMRIGMTTAVLHGRELAPLIFNVTQGFLSQVIRAEDVAGATCDAEDTKAAKTSWSSLQTKFLDLLDTAIKEMEPLMNVSFAPGSPVEFTAASTILRSWEKMGKKFMHEFPASCKPESVLSQGWQQIVTCVYQATNISKPCVRCVPRLFHSISENCQSSCVEGILSIGKEVNGDLLPIAGELAPFAMSSHVSDEQRSKLKGKIDGLEKKVMRSLKHIVPCVTCMHRKVDKFATCVSMGKTAKDGVDQMLNGLVESLKVGNLTVPTSFRPRNWHAPTPPSQAFPL